MSRNNRRHAVLPVIAGLLLAGSGFTTHAGLIVGANTNVTKLAGNQTETTVALNLLHPQNLFVACNNGTFPTPGLFRYSTNGGVTWNISDVSTLPTACCDEASAWDEFGNLFLTYLTVIGSTAVVAVSTNGGANFALVFQSPDSIDQPSIAVGPGGAYAPGSVWVTYASAAGPVALGAPVTGLGQVGAFGVPQLAPGPGGTYGDIAVGPGGQVMMVYEADTAAAGPSTLYCCLDPDGLGPAGFNPAIAATVTQVGSVTAIPAQPKRKIDAEAGLAWDRSGGPHNGRVYLVYTDRPNTSSADTDIYVRYSSDQGTNWSAPVRVNDDPAGKSQFLPRIALDQTTGNIAVSFYDCRNSSGNNTPQFWATLSADGGRSFLPNVKVSAGTSTALTTAVSTSGFDFGDYTGLAFHDSVFYPCWGDNSNSTSDNPDGTAHTLDVYVSAVTVDLVPMLTITATGPNSARIAWPYPARGYLLLQKSGLAGGTWETNGNPVTVSGTEKEVMVSPVPSPTFFRLMRP